MTARQANTFIKASEAIGLYVYARTVCENEVRVIRVKRIDGALCGMSLTAGTWLKIIPYTLEAR
jgi:hypothetical protein